jgi:YVTN family beta-propeller protein
VLKKISALMVTSLACFWLELGSANAQPFVYVTDVSINTVTVIDAASNTITATITVDNNPEEIAITPDGMRAYVTCGSFGTSSSVPVIDTATNTVITTIPMPFGSFARGIAITPNGKTAYVSNFAANMVSRIDTATNTVTGTIPVGNNPVGVAISPDGTRAYVANDNSSSVSVIDTTISLVIGTVPVGDQPHNLLVTPDGKHVYVADDTFPQGNVSVIDTATNQVTTIATPEGTNWVAVTPDGATVYATNFTSVSVIDTATNTITATIPGGLEDSGVAFSSGGLHAYVASTSEGGSPQNAVLVIDTTAKAVSATILFPPGSGPFGVAVTTGPACDTTYNGTFKGNLIISRGRVCIINGTVTGNVVQSGGSLFTSSATIRGNLQVNGGGSFSIGAGTSIGGNFQVTNLPAGTAQNQICGATVHGSLQFQNNASANEIGSMSPSCAGNSEPNRLGTRDRPKHFVSIRRLHNGQLPRRTP